MHPANVKIILSNIRTSDYGRHNLVVSWPGHAFFFSEKTRPIGCPCRCRKDFSVNETTIVDLRVNSLSLASYSKLGGRREGKTTKFIDP